MTNAIQALQHTSRVLNITSLNSRLVLLDSEAETLDESDDFVVCQLDAAGVSDALPWIHSELDSKDGVKSALI